MHTVEAYFSRVALGMIHVSTRSSVRQALTPAIPVSGPLSKTVDKVDCYFLFTLKRG